MTDPITATLVSGRATDALRTVFDPELGIDVVTLGLIYGIESDGDSITIDMTLTTPGCPVSESLPREARDAVQAEFPDQQVDVRVVWDPPWSPDRIDGSIFG